MTTSDLLTEIQRGATEITYDANRYQFDDALLRQAGAVVRHRPMHQSPDRKTVLSVCYTGAVVTP